MVDTPIPFGTPIPVSLRERVRQHAAESGVSINDVVQTALERHLARSSRTNPIPRVTIGPKRKRT